MPTLTEASAGLVGLTALLTALGYVIRKLRKAARVLDAIDRVVHRELTHNHGSSIKDDAVGTALSVGHLSRTVDDLVHRVSDLERTRDLHHPPERPAP